MKFKSLAIITSLILGGSMTFGNNITKQEEIPIKRVTLYSSGVGYFEHNGTIENATKLSFPFETSALNDVLKSITIYDPNTVSPLISYPSEETLRRTLESLSINLGNNPSIVEILNSLRGAEIKIFASKELTGKIIGASVKKVKVNDEVVEESTLSLLSAGQIQVIKTDEIVSYSFVDPKITEDMNRALELILNSKNSNIKNINIHLTGEEKRDIALSYVVASPVWKATYRFDLEQEKPYLQGWAIVDNVGEMDWNNVELSLVTGRPVSFIQELYTPYHLTRPTVPLAIAGYAAARVYDDGFADSFGDMRFQEMEMAEDAEIVRKEVIAPRAKISRLGYSAVGAMHDAPVTNTKHAGEMFVFTSPKPVTLERQQSAMIPLVQTTFEASKISIFDGSRASITTPSNPALGVKFKNNSGMKLPAGPVTIYDDGTYVGDALLEFLPENATRIISYGDDLSVNGIISNSSKSTTDQITINEGILTFKIKDVYEKIYTLKNHSEKSKNIVVEHPIIHNAQLIEPQKYSEKTGTVYRFEVLLDGNKEVKFPVKEELWKYSRISILDMDIDSLVSYSTNSEIPENIREYLKKAVSLYSEMENINNQLENYKEMYTAKINDQDRIRKNIDAVKSDSAQGKEYVKKLVELDTEIENLDKKMEETTLKLQELKKAYDGYIKSLK